MTFDQQQFETPEATSGELTPEELQAEAAVDLPSRDAMSIIAPHGMPPLPVAWPPVGLPDSAAPGTEPEYLGPPDPAPVVAPGSQPLPPKDVA